MSSARTAIVIGSGIGGLLSAAVLCRYGYRVIVLERLAFPGGKFTSINDHGFEVPTGALHLLPGGDKGPLYTAFRSLGVAPELRLLDRACMVRFGGRRYAVSRWLTRRDNFLRRLPLRDKIAAARLIGQLVLHHGKAPDLSLADHVSRLGAGPVLTRLIDKVIQFASGASIEEASMADVAGAFAAQHGAKEGVIVGGCGRVVASLVRDITDRGGRLELASPAKCIQISAQGGLSVHTESGAVLPADVVVSNAGPAETVRLLGPRCPPWLLAQAASAIPAYGTSFSVRSRVPLLDHPFVEVPLDMDYLSGYIQVSLSDPGLAPDGWHYLLAYQRLSPHDIEGQVKSALDELLSLFPGLKSDDVFNVSVFRGEWPAARLLQRVGQSGCQRFPVAIRDVPGLFMVGHDSQGYGFAAEVIGSALRVFDKELGGKVIAPAA